jgi:hypothetical protein
MIATNEELREELLRSKKFLQWRVFTKPKAPYGRGQDFNYVGDKYTNLVVDEKHFTPSDLAKAWGVSAETVRQIFRDEPDVLRVGSNGVAPPSISGKRKYVLLRIPESVAARVHKRLSTVPR